MSDSGIFKAAVKLPADQRAAYLDQACGDNLGLRQEVESLLQAHEASGSFLEGISAGRGMTQDYQPITERPGTVIGPYKLMEQIGEGGFGLVFVAEQQHPVRRKVALKIIKPGMDSREVIARFEAERQALALMDHPNIAKVLDAGTTDSGRPYFVMELVKGIPLADYCDQQQLTTRERLELFLSVCQAVQHAHGKGVIHRDLKPNNILVAPHDGVPVVKVIDFGVAKAIGQQLTDKTVYTRFNQMIGTPLYMSPEQAEINALDVDIRSDVYSLGVLLYELLTGTTPFDRQRFATAAFDEIRRIIREEEPPKPSTRLSTPGEALSKVSAQRRTEPAKLSALVKGDLDWIVMKALEKDRNRRYETASAFAADVRRFLADEPVEARPPSPWYRFRKMARRNKVVLTTAAVVGLALIAGSVVSTWQAVRATRAESEAVAQRNLAREAEQEATTKQRAAEDAEKRASAEKANAQAALHFLLADVLEQADPFHEPNRDLKVRDLLDTAAKRLEKNKGMTPPVEAAIRQTVGKVYSGLGEPEKAERQLTQAYELQQRSGETDRDTLETAFYLAVLYFLQTDYDKAEPFCLTVIEGRSRLFGDEDSQTLRAKMLLAAIYTFRDEPARAEPLLATALEASRKRYGDQAPITLLLLRGLGVAYHMLGRYAEAEPLLVKCLEGHRAVLTDNNLDTMTAESVLAVLYLEMGRLADAEQHASIAFKARYKVLGERHPVVLNSQGILATVYIKEGRLTDAANLLEGFRQKALAQQDRLPPFTIWRFCSIGIALLGQREFAEAETFLRFYLKLAAKKHPDGWRRNSAVSALGACLLGQKKYAEAEELLLKGYAGLRQYEQSTPPSLRQIRLTEALERLVHLYEEWDKPDEAAKWRKELEGAKAAAKSAAGP